MATPGLPLPQAYASAASAVAAEVARMALVVRRALCVLRHQELAGAASGFDAGRADRELARLENPADRAPRILDRESESVAERLALREQIVAQDRAATTAIPLPLYRLAERAALSPLAFDLFLLTLAPEIDDGFSRIYQLLRGPGRRGLDVASAARLLTPTDPAASALRRSLAPGAPLFDLGLIELGEEGGDTCSMATTLSVPPAVITFVLGHEVHESLVRALLVERAQLFPRARSFVPDAVWPQLTALVDDEAALPLLEGPAGSGKRLAVRALAAERGVRVVELDLTVTPAAFGQREAIAAARLAWLSEAWVLLALPPPPTDEAPKLARSWQPGVSALLARFPGRVILSRDLIEPAPIDLGIATERRLSPVQVPAPEAEARDALWRDRLGKAVGDVDFGLLAHTYPITGGIITRIANEAHILAHQRADSPVEQRDVMAAIDATFRPVLSKVGRRLTTRATHEDLIISDETRETLMELESTIRLRSRVLDEWKFRRLVHGRGVSALFYGDPGTGKTMAAGVIAAASGLPLYVIDTGSLVSKWVGETEKNLGETFRAAEAGHAMLLFDEADAIFGKRTDVQSSTDRYANMQTNFLLTQIEMFNGVSILTTNRESVMDQAFQRRLTFRVHFPMPEDDERERLWQQMLTGHAAQVDEIDYKLLAKRLQLSGGYIRNAVMRAGYLAAAQKVPITTQLLKHAAELVLRDAGRVI
jgi:ATP-dependent 26S proteasome regulatory subunit